MSFRSNAIQIMSEDLLGQKAALQRRKTFGVDCKIIMCCLGRAAQMIAVFGLRGNHFVFFVFTAKNSEMLGLHGNQIRYVGVSR